MIICIGREFGSGGHEIGKRIAQNLDLSFYDEELLENAVEKTKIAYKKLQKADEKKANAFFHTVLYDTEDKNLRGLSANDILFEVQKKIILELAQDNKCVFVGRCADYVLSKENIKYISLFITAPFSDRVQRKKELLDLDEQSAAVLVQKTDKQRKAYYNYYSGGNWGKPYNYDVCVNSSSLGIENTARVLSLMMKDFEKMEKISGKNFK